MNELCWFLILWECFNFVGISDEICVKIIKYNRFGPLLIEEPLTVRL
jgi:hypothetical protein